MISAVFGELFTAFSRQRLYKLQFRTFIPQVYETDGLVYIQNMQSNRQSTYKTGNTKI